MNRNPCPETRRFRAASTSSNEIFKSPVFAGCINCTGTWLYHFPYDDQLISRDTYTAALNTAAYLSLIHSFTMVEYTNTEYTDMVLVYNEATGSYRTYSIPSKIAALVPEFAMEDLPSAELQPRSLCLQ